MKKRSGQTTLGDALGGYLRRIDKHGGLARARVNQVWAEAVGPEVARHTAGLHMRESELVVYVDSPVWATELTALSSTLVTRVNASLGQDLVSSVRFSVSRKVQRQAARDAQEAEDERFYTEDVVEPQSLTAVEIEQIRQSVSSTRNPELKEAVVRATVKHLEWMRGLERRDGKRGS